MLNRSCFWLGYRICRRSEILGALARRSRKMRGMFSRGPRVASAARTYPGLMCVAPLGLQMEMEVGM